MDSSTPVPSPAERGPIAVANSSALREAVESASWWWGLRTHVDVRASMTVDADIEVYSAVTVSTNRAANLVGGSGNRFFHVWSGASLRLVGLGTLPMQAPELAVREVRRAVSKGLAGLLRSCSPTSMWLGGLPW